MPPSLPKLSPDEPVDSGKECPWLPLEHKKHLVPNHPLRLVAFSRAVMNPRASLYCNFVQTDSLYSRPNDGEATGLGGEHLALMHLQGVTLRKQTSTFQRWFRWRCFMPRDCSLIPSLDAFLLSSPVCCEPSPSFPHSLVAPAKRCYNAVELGGNGVRPGKSQLVEE